MTDNPIDLDDIGRMLGKVLAPPTKRRTSTTKRRTSTTTSRSRSTSGSDMDAAVRRAVRAELEDVTRAIRDLTDEIARLRRANEALETRIARLTGR